MSPRKETLYPYDGPLSGSAYMARVKLLPCVCCGRHPVDVHHVRSGHYSGGRRANDWDTIPLCDFHHEGQWAVSDIAFHRNKRLWEDTYGPDHEYIPAVRAEVENTI